MEDDKVKYLRGLRDPERAKKIADEAEQRRLDFERQRKSLSNAPVDMAQSDLFDKDIQRVKSIAPSEPISDIQNVLPIEAWKTKIASKLKNPGYEKILDYTKKVGKTGLKSIPLVGALGAALTSDDASAALPVLGEADDAGMSSQDEDMMMAEIQARKDYGNSRAAQDKIEALKKMKQLK